MTRRLLPALSHQAHELIPDRVTSAGSHLAQMLLMGWQRPINPERPDTLVCVETACRDAGEARDWVVQATARPGRSLVRIWKGDLPRDPRVCEPAPTLDEARLLALLQTVKGEAA